MISMSHHSPALDIDAVRAFSLIAELKSFTRAAQAIGVTQSAISLQLKRLEARLAARLIERTPRSVRLTAAGISFLARGRELLAAHDRALATDRAAERRLTLGISDHVAGPEVAELLKRINAADPGLRLDVRIDLSGTLVERFDSGKLDAVIVRREKHRRGGEILFEDEAGWFATPAFRHTPGTALRLAMLAAPCGVRAAAIQALDKSKIDWAEAFTGGGVAAIAAAVLSDLAVAPLARRIAPPGTIDVGATLRLPPLGRSKVVLHSRVSDARALAALRILAATFRATAAR